MPDWFEQIDSWLNGVPTWKRFPLMVVLYPIIWVISLLALPVFFFYFLPRDLIEDRRNSKRLNAYLSNTNRVMDWNLACDKLANLQGSIILECMPINPGVFRAWWVDVVDTNGYLPTYQQYLAKTIWRFNLKKMETFMSEYDDELCTAYFVRDLPISELQNADLPNDRLLAMGGALISHRTEREMDA